MTYNDVEGQLGSKREELDVSNSSPHYPNDQKTGNGRPARRPTVLTWRLTASAVNGPPRSVVKTWLASGVLPPQCSAAHSFFLF
jgi:hypothetical protein